MWLRGQQLQRLIDFSLSDRSQIWGSFYWNTRNALVAYLLVFVIVRNFFFVLRVYLVHTMQCSIYMRLFEEISSNQYLLTLKCSTLIAPVQHIWPLCHRKRSFRMQLTHSIGEWFAQYTMKVLDPLLLWVSWALLLHCTHSTVINE